MKLELFDFIDETLDILDKNSNGINEVALELEKFFNDSFFIKDHFLNVNYRIKSAESLKEKILRYNFYLKYNTPQELLRNLSDLIGFRIECRFVEDEGQIYKDILELFSIELEDGYHSNHLNSAILLKLDDKQPQTQKNGFEIYKIDGKYKKDEVEINFELQIKSLVNVFWGEIDHKVLYKNFNYMLTEDFFRDIMSSIKDNLTMIDRQLMILYNQLSQMDTSNSFQKQNQLRSLVSKITHDIYITKVRQELGFVIDFKKPIDVISNYLFMKGEHEGNGSYSRNFLRILNRLDEISSNRIDFNNYIEFEREIFFNDSFTRKIGSKILDVINRDFRWNLLFKIIFEIEEGSNAEDFEGFIIYLRYLYHEGILEALKDKEVDIVYKEVIVHTILDAIANSFNKEISIDFISECSINKVMCIIKEELNDVVTYEDFISKKDELVSKICEIGI
ncbi:MAG: (p)ppGpp synthetase [Tissierellaceae bacterium]|nr:(p)ppGpp synthetase [Tissierellaceae bacterium]